MLHNRQIENAFNCVLKRRFETAFCRGWSLFPQQVTYVSFSVAYSLTNGQGISGNHRKVRELIHWSVKLGKSQIILSVVLGSQGIIV